MNIYEQTFRIYWQIKDEIERLGCKKVPHFICNEAPNISVKHKVISFTRKLGLKTDGMGTLRLTVAAPEYNEKGEKLFAWFPGKKYEVYLHCCHIHIKNGYFSAKDRRRLLTLGFYTGS